MDHILLRVLLLVVFLNTTLGTPLHAAVHLHGPATAVGQSCADLHGHGAAAADDCAGGGEGTDHGSCTWCPAHAQLAAALTGGTAPALALLDPAAVFNPTAHPAHLPQPERWRFAARDPPRLS